MAYQIVDDQPSPSDVARAKFYADKAAQYGGTPVGGAFADLIPAKQGGNYFDQFDQPKPDYSAMAAQYGGTTVAPSGGNYFDQFDKPTGGAFADLIPGNQTPRYTIVDGDGKTVATATGKAAGQIGQPQDLTFAEKYVAPVLDALGNAVASDPGAVGAVARALGNNGNFRGSAAGRFFQGAADPGTAVAQAVANALPGTAGQAANAAIAQNERQYQAARAAAGSTGFDPLRAAGNIAVTAPIPLGAAAPETLLGTIGKGAVQGAVGGAVQPVTNAGDVPDYWRQKLADVAKGTIAGGIAAPVVNTVARIVSPLASSNADVQLLRDEGVQPTIGQTLGGWANAMEEKAQSLPILGDAIAAARGRARAQFDNAAINRTLQPIGASVEGAGQPAIRAAGDKLSAAYDDAISQLHHVNFDTPEFNKDFGNLLYMGSKLPNADLRQQFSDVVNDTILGNMSPNGSMLGQTFKNVDSELAGIASNYSRSSVASERNLGAAVDELRTALRNQVSRTNPAVGDALDAADAGWAQLVRVEQAGKMAKNTAGVFTPAQFNSAVSALDDSVRRRAVSRGTALMQDLGNAGQNVLGNKVADSGTVGRALLAGGAIATGAANPMIPLGLTAGAAAYLPPVQNVLRAIVANRPDAAPQVANYLRQVLALPAAYGAGVLAGGAQ